MAAAAEEAATGAPVTPRHPPGVQLGRINATVIGALCVFVFLYTVDVLLIVSACAPLHCKSLPSWNTPHAYILCKICVILTPCRADHPVAQHQRAWSHEPLGAHNHDLHFAVLVPLLRPSGSRQAGGACSTPGAAPPAARSSSFQQCPFMCWPFPLYLEVTTCAFVSHCRVPDDWQPDAEQLAVTEVKRKASEWF
jgi:hypothetical protein